MRFLQVSGRDITDEEGNKVYLRGVNLGGWLMMEGYILGGRNIPESEFKRSLTREIGKRETEEFFKQYRNTFIEEKDIAIIKSLGFNVIRVPFNHSLIEGDSKEAYSEEGFIYLDKIIDWCDKYGIYCIFDLHSAPGSQNKDWHSDSTGKALLWEREKYQERTFSLWKEVARRYHLKACIAGYDVLNEPVIDDKDRLNSLYRGIVDSIRSVDKKHIIFLEGNNWAQDLSVLDTSFDGNIAYSIHFYQPIEFTFNFRPGSTYPGNIAGENWDGTRLLAQIKPYAEFGERHNAPVFVGEFGINLRCPQCRSELKWVEDVLEIFLQFEFHWTYWTYKTVAGEPFPDGLFRLEENLTWIGRGSRVRGWENFALLLRREKNQILQSLSTDNFVKQEALISLLKRFLS